MKPDGRERSGGASLDTAVVGKHYAVGGSTARKPVTNGGAYTTNFGTYKVVGLSARLSSGFTLHGRSHRQRGDRHRDADDLPRPKQTGTGPPTAAVPLSYKIVKAGEVDARQGRPRMGLHGRARQADVRGWEKASISVGKLKQVT